MVKRMVKSIGLMTAVVVIAGCGAAPGDESEEVATESEELPCTDCGGDPGGYEPYYPYDDACGYGETRWNSATNCDPSSPCSSGTGCSTLTYRCGSNGCGTSTNTSSTNPCYQKYYGAACTLTGGFTGVCRYDFSYQLACFAY